jgi:DNA transformation protein
VRLSALRNLGAKSEERLAEIGINTPEELDETGPVECYLRLKAAFPTTTLNWLYALHGAVLDLRWEHITPEMRRELRAEATEKEAHRPQKD